ncbi:zinc transporter ZIP3 [Nilaparvata lugens]|uniref:zinc transporter ZIP3 n=1 Tax=Nilaparvata lugens TaxID=108931 RepID=UPI00193DE716|nr:zinc transporter ZIP3 [Nilaparvata lugens]XP_022205401.2 zinc transporter ZIP3 [Nilaparvata lugens]XP_022205417.2 zinc transporter ZIP3 [Nilaparvata lugens]XP_039278420.1 zinc transporter ZIP3 [Nilaparvata lugens]XP_039278421.1 zinc transporter ZIP3 [Nilaparvata lugens]XP_039278422.1 zinc transporter ZIP3 [Nilaparvata lugens]XP_039278423.1 zinc transporter ZIP3 [Nilaparvata lugens]XP_039278424.1 zinc transporter ZIP3 [Nilaparvata lugens]XP_039278425.1 zinc transporter ZIP3 [Nilaparvata l
MVADMVTMASDVVSQNGTMASDVVSESTLLPKAVGVVAFVVGSLLMGLLPMALQRRYRETFSGDALSPTGFFGQISAFGGGVLLSTTFLHLLPEVREGVEDLQKEKELADDEALPLAELLMCVGFIFLYIVESVAHRYVSHTHVHHVEADNGDKVVEFVNKVYNKSSPQHTMENGHTTDNDDVTIMSRVDTKDPEKAKITNGVTNDYGAAVTNNDHLSASASNHNHAAIFDEVTGKNFLLVFALSIHEVFEGLAIGLESSREAVWYMLLGVGAHKLIIAFCVGVQMLSMRGRPMLAVSYVVLFATTTSLAIVAGVFISAQCGLLSVVLQGLATGTLLYVVFFELLKPHAHKSPCCGVVVGFTLMAVLKYYTPE